uniref:Si:dkey-242h9.5 n=1 Tax=Cyprinus carpio carpio TaxID=630221 RepID=A0A9J7X3L7_CYPCA
GGTNAAHLAEHLVLLKTRGGHLIPLHHAGKQADICILWIGGGRQAGYFYVEMFCQETLLKDALSSSLAQALIKTCHRGT